MDEDRDPIKHQPAWSQNTAVLIGGGMGLLGVLVLVGSVILTTQRSSRSFPTTVMGETRADGAKRLTDGTGPASYQNACFSPDSTQLVYTRWRDGYNAGPADLVIRDLATRADRVLIGDGDSANVTVPFGCWRGNDIVFASDRASDGPDELWLIAADGTNLRRLTTHTDDETYIEPVFSADGTQIAFEANRASDETDQSLGQIMTINRDSTNLTRLTDASGTDDRLPSWSQDGKLLFQRRVAIADGWSDWAVYVMEQQPDGVWTSPRPVTPSSSGDETDASWSPDGQFILSSSDYDQLDYPNIFAFPLSGGEPTRLTTSDEREDGAPSISPDGRWLVFESHRTAAHDSPSDLWLKQLSPSMHPSTK